MQFDQYHQRVNRSIVALNNLENQIPYSEDWDIPHERVAESIRIFKDHLIDFRRFLGDMKEDPEVLAGQFDQTMQTLDTYLAGSQNLLDDLQEISRAEDIELEWKLLGRIQLEVSDLASDMRLDAEHITLDQKNLDKDWFNLSNKSLDQLLEDPKRDRGL